MLNVFLKLIHTLRVKITEVKKVWKNVCCIQLRILSIIVIVKAFSNTPQTVFFFQSRLMSYFAVWPLKVYKALAINCGLLASLLTLSSSSLRLLASSASYSRLNRSSSSSLFLLIISSSASLLLLSSSSLRLCSSSSSSLLRRAASSSRLLNTSSSEGGCCLTCSSSDAFLAASCYYRSNQSQSNHIIRATSFVYG